MNKNILQQLVALPVVTQGQRPPKASKPAFDAVGATMDAATAYAEADIRVRAVAALHQWVESDDLGEGETSADRLLALMVGIADADKDGEITDDENDVINLALDAAYDYLLSAGVTEDDASTLLSDWAPDVAERVRELLASALPDDEGDEAIDAFVFGASDQEPALDAVYKLKMAIRNGRKVRIRKRISGTVRLTPRQKVAIAKMHRRSHSAAAVTRRLRSMRLARRMSL